MGQDAIISNALFWLFGDRCRAVALGNARAALDDVIDLATQKRAMGHTRTLAERSGVQAALAEAEAEWRSIDAFYWQTLTRIWEDVQAGADMTP